MPSEKQRHKRFGWTKKGDVEHRNYEAKERAGEPSFKRRSKSKSKEKWMQHATKHPEATRKYLQEEYGGRAFNRNGTIKMSVLEEAIARAKADGNTERERQLVLARTYKEDGGR